MAGNLFQRYVWLLETIKGYNGITFEQINEAWQRSRLNDDGTPLPKRTLHNHIEAIEEMFNMRIICQKQGGYKYHIEDIEGGKLSDTQKALLGYLQLSNRLLDSSINRYIELAYCPIYDHIQTLTEAINSKRYISFCWTKPECEAQLIEMAPYYLKQFMNVHNDWYIVGVLCNGEAVFYNLNNISDIKILNKQFTHPEMSYKVFYDSVDMDHKPACDTDDSMDIVFNQLWEDGDFETLLND